MLRPEQMSKVSVTGSKRFMDDVIETVHELNLLHVTDYDGSWEEFQQGDPLEGAETASDKLVTVRSLESILDVDAEDAGPTRIVDDDELEAELEEVRARVNELDDRRDELRTDLRDIDERIDAMSPFAELGIDLDLLSGYDSIQVVVGQGKVAAVEDALAHADDIGLYQTFSEGNVVAAFARPADGADEDALADALVGADFAAFAVPEADASPEEYVSELEHKKQQLRSELNTVEDELESVKLEAAGFLLAAEEKLSIDVQKTEAPLSFATTENAFVAEGWIPTTKFGDFVSGLESTVGSHVEVEEVERASFTSSGHEAVRESVGDTGGAVAADGGHDVVMRKDDPPTVQSNSGVVKPFEVLVNAVGRPNYREFDPSIILFLTFPAFFGFMIGDLGYGLVYTAIGYFLYTNFDSQGIKSMGGVTLFAGGFTALFGILYGEIFGLHLVSTYFWEGALGMSHAPMLKGLAPAEKEWALGWLTVSVLLGVLHLNIGWGFDFIENLELHDFKHALYESGSWLLMMNGLWVMIFSGVTEGTAPEFLFTTFSAEGVIPIGFTGFPTVVGFAGLAVFAVGLLLLLVGEPAEAIEFLNVLVNVLSYTRIAAVLLAKAGMAFTVNLLFFGAYSHEGEFHFMLEHGPDYVIAEYGREAIMFGGLMHGGAAALVGGLLVLLVGHLLVLVLGVTSAGLQAVRLEYVEFFGKFYDGGGREYAPFGYERQFTTED